MKLRLVIEIETGLPKDAHALATLLEHYAGEQAALHRRQINTRAWIIKPNEQGVFK